MIYSPAPAGVWPARPPENPGRLTPACHGVRHFSVMSFLLFLLPEAGTPSAPGCLAASGRRPDYDRQLLAHPPVSAEPAGAVSGCRYGPMSEKPGLQRPFRSRRKRRSLHTLRCVRQLRLMAQSTLPPPPLRPVSRCGLYGGWSNHIPFQQSRGRYTVHKIFSHKPGKKFCVRPRTAAP